MRPSATKPWITCDSAAQPDDSSRLLFRTRHDTANELTNGRGHRAIEGHGVDALSLTRVNVVHS